ncbi:MAG: hypothetical protein OEY14_19110 [Myxococcales bacterium]|nr:hypothetical protein [Myxococcales bacterium]
MPTFACIPRLGAPLLLGALFLACSSSGRTGGGEGGGMDGGGSGLGESGPEACTDGVDNDGDGLRDCSDPGCSSVATCAGGAGDGGAGADAGIDECSAVNAAATTALAPVDIVWVIDNSGSMSEEASLVQTNVNRFAADIVAAGIDVHVILITRPGFVTVPPPLGTDPSAFLHVEEDVQSSNSFEKIIASYPRWEGFLRRSAALHFVEVTDDESSMAGAAFRATMEGLLGKNFTFHSIVSPPGSTRCSDPFLCLTRLDGCTGSLGDAADNGDTYWALSAATGGRQFSICSEDWSSLFVDLSRTIAIPTPLPCVYEIPEPPAGMSFDPAEVNIVFTTGGAPSTVPFVGTVDRCGDLGWYYEGDPANPERIIVCPFTCATFEADLSASIAIQLGCATLLI